jgi:hypothetical protein
VHTREHARPKLGLLWGVHANAGGDEESQVQKCYCGFWQARKASAQRDGTLESVRGLGNVDVSTSARVLVCKNLEQVWIACMYRI